MPKDTTSRSHSRHTTTPSDAAASGKMADVAVRKKKNADAQAAFRARRANYITTLEETVTSLESVVLQLQDSCRDTRAETSELRKENSKLRQQLCEQEKYIKGIMRKSISAPGVGSTPSTAGAGMHHASQSTRVGSSTSFGVDQYTGRPGASTISSGAYAGHTLPSADFSGQVSAMQSGYVDSAAGSSSAKYATSQYTGYASGSGSPDGTWTPVDSNGVMTGAPPSTTFSPDPSTLSGSYYSKDSLHSLDPSPYVFSSESLSPSDSPSSSTSLTAPFNNQYAYASADGARAEYDAYRRTHGSNSAADTMSVQPSDSYRAGSIHHAYSNHSNSPSPLAERTYLNEDRTLLIGPRSAYDVGSAHPSRSPSPCEEPPLSGTLSVLKAQAFGALRRTRCRTKLGDELMKNAKVANDVLQERGIVAGGGRRSLSGDDDDYYDQ
ncbi:hypothetical protein BDV98DRAFT_657725 [Pterulicium gracile]|uniref:BZIP domain-containing protein n=1 Tax=Pterulicium gracile TaxID=1884261 RepID=A0A5C3Q9K4_9AGAR|nr:hypothetical protein BDV98DRAFT_657725 [Pterula gracilis]